MKNENEVSRIPRRTLLIDDTAPLSNQSDLEAASKVLEDILSPAGFEMKETTDRVFYRGMYITAIPQPMENGAVHYSVVAELICPFCAEYTSIAVQSLEDLHRLYNDPHTCGVQMIDTGQWRRNKKKPAGTG